MALDTAKNFARGTLSTTYNGAATSIVLTTGHGAKFPAVPFNATWWDSSVYPDASQDPNVEIVRVTNISSDTLTVTRAQEGTSASTKSTGGSTYSLVAGVTAKLVNVDLPALFVQGAANLTTAGAIPYVDTAGVVQSDTAKIVFDATNSYLGIGMAVPTNEIQIQKTKSGGSTIVAIQNLSNTASSNAFFASYTAGASAGYSGYKLSCVGVQDWLISHSAADSKFKIAASANTSSNVWLTILVGGKVGITEQTPGSLLSVKGNATIGNDTAYSQAGAPTDGLAVKGVTLIGTMTDDTVNKLQVNGSITGTALKTSASSTSGTIYFGSDLTTYISRSTTTLNIVGPTAMSFTGTMFNSGDFVLAVNNTTFYGKDTAATSIGLMKMASDNTVRLGCLSTPASNGHLLIFANATEYARCLPSGLWNFGLAAQTPTAQLTVNTQSAMAGSALSTAFLVNAGTVGGTTTNEVHLGSIGGKANTNSVAFGVHLYRASTGSDWTTTAIGIGMDVDSTVRGGANMWFHANGKIGIGTITPVWMLTMSGTGGGSAATSATLNLLGTSNTGGVCSGVMRWEGSTGKVYTMQIGGSSEFYVRDVNNSWNCFQVLTGGSFYIGKHSGVASWSTTVTLGVYDSTASTGVTRVGLRCGAGQSTTNLMEFFANDGTTLVASIGPAGEITHGIPKFAGTNTTGVGSAALGANSPAVTNTAPYTWIQVTAADGSTCYIPAWK